MSYTKGGINKSSTPENKVKVKKVPTTKLGFAWHKVWVKVATISSVFIVAIVTFASFLYFDMSNTFSTNKFTLDFIADRPPVDPDAGEAINILAMVYDTYGNDGGKITNDDSGHANADSNVLIHISSDRTNVEMVSIPRDLLIDIPDCDVEGGDVVYGREMSMFNSAFGYAYLESGDLASGVNCAVKTVEEMTDIKIDYSGVLDFNGFYEMIEALGGVEICIPEDVGPLENAGGLTLTAGVQRLDAWETTQYGRARLGIDDSSDITRMKRQQRVLGAMINEVLNQMKDINFTNLYDFFKNLLASLNTNMSMEEVVGLAYSLKDINKENIRSFTAPIGSDPAYPNRLVLLSNADVMWEKIRKDVALFDVVGAPDDSEETPTDATDNDEPIDVEIENTANEEPEDISLTGETEDGFTYIAPAEDPTVCG